MQNAFFSIILPTYNRSNFLGKAIESVLSQTFSNWELLIVDDGSTDNTKEVVDYFKDSRIQYFFQQNAERSAARNKGISNAKGNYISFLDSDDYMLPDFLEKLAKEIALKNNPIAIFFSRVMVENQGLFKIQFDIFPETDSIIKYILSEFKVIQVSQAIIHRKIFENNLFDERFYLWEDTHLYLRLIAQYPYFNCNVNGVILVQHPNSTVVKGMNVVKKKDVEQYIFAVKDLRDNYWYLFEKYIQKKYFRNYINAKLNMYLYQARINKQFGLAVYILCKLLLNKVDLKNIIIALKLFIHFTISFFRK
ncbi:MAG TPA: glycosyltransferase family 2 protein [Bacteroidales bacterium]|nr:glycosyltransferase family 2 protein [Bacteroidales bacterium]HPS15948.1 glycosyltransferase family 2 protein [Bacteroidales bacterium]